MKTEITFFLVSTLLVTLMITDISHAYQYGPVIDRKLIYGMKYTTFISDHIEAAKVGLALETGTPYPNVPQYPIDYRNVPFYLYTKNNPNIPQVLFVGDSKKRLYLAGFDPRRETILYAHGYNRTFDDSASNFTSALFPRKDINIFIINYDSYAFFDVNYSQIVTIPRLAKIIARFVQTLIYAGADRKMMNLMGMSAGAEAVALAAQQIRPKVGRVTGFDPAGGYFNLLPPNQRISNDDADYVQIVHCTVSKQALPPEIKGDVTFYMNGALIQPQCVKYTDIETIGQCSHVTCESYVYESLKKNDTLVGIKCDGFLSQSPKDYNFSDKVMLTYDVPTNIKGLYCVHTDTPAPPNFDEIM